MSLAELLQQLDGEIAARFARSASETRQQLLERLQRAHDEVARTLAEAVAPAAGSFLPTEQLTQLAADAQQAGRDEGREQGRSEGREQGRSEALGALRDGLQRIDRAANQAEVLRALLDAARTFGGRAALFLTPADGVRGWGASGFGGGLRNIDELAFDATRDAPWDEFAAGRGVLELTAGESARIVSDLDPALPLAGALVPLVLRDQLAAALYVDRLEAGGRFELPALQTLAFCAAQAIELLAFRERRSTPTLQLAAEVAEEAPGLALWQAAIAPAAAVAEVAAGEAPAAAAPYGETEYELGAEVESIPLVEEQAAPPAIEPAWEMAAEEPVAEAPAPTAEAPAPVVEPTAGWPAPAEPAWEMAPEEPAPLPEPVWTPTEVIPPAIEPPHVEPWAAEPAPAAEPAWPVPQEPVLQAPPEPAWPAEPEPPAPPVAPIVPSPAPTAPFLPPAAAAPPAPAPPSDASEDETVMLAHPAPAAPVPSPFATTATPEAVAPARPAVHEAEEGAKFASRGAEVVPPSDLSGPGWAFSTSRIPVAATGDEALHEEARRLARLLVSEIKLYNEEQVEEGRRNRDVYHRLREDIDRSRQLYEERVAERIRATTDYFYQELVRNLAGGDARALGM